MLSRACLAVANRALLGDKVFFVTDHARMVALDRLTFFGGAAKRAPDAKTGELQWRY